MSLAVLGTDTGVGKTVVTAGVTGWLRREGTDAVAVKPCQTGAAVDDDAGVVQRVCGDDDAAVTLRTLEPPLAPAVAARREGRSLSYEAILDDCRDAIEAAPFGILEGIGGVRVPLADDREVIDLVADLELPALVVARSDLGTLNHTAMTVQVLRDAGVAVTGVVANEYRGETTAERTNPAVIERMVDAPVATLPPMDVTTPETVVTTVGDGLSSEFVSPAGTPFD